MCEAERERKRAPHSPPPLGEKEGVKRKKKSESEEVREGGSGCLKGRDERLGKGRVGGEGGGLREEWREEGDGTGRNG